MKKFIVLLAMLFTIPSANAGEFKINEAEIALISLAVTGYSLTQIEEQDKQSHAYVGMILGGWSRIATREHEHSFWISTGVVAVVAAWKEWGYDPHNNGTTEEADFWYTLIPGMLTAYNIGKVIHYYDSQKKKHQLVKFATDGNNKVNYVFYQDVKRKDNHVFLGFHKSFAL